MRRLKSGLKSPEKNKGTHEEHCDSCETPISKREYRKNSGFCKKCYKLYFD